jgi:hypothetical protein
MNLDAQKITVPWWEAKSLWREYHAHKATATEMDREIARMYHAIGRGEVVIDAFQAVIDAGTNDQGFPKLALCRADSKKCALEMWRNGRAKMKADYTFHGRKNARVGTTIEFRAGSFPRSNAPGEPWEVLRRAEALVPFIPPKHRPSTLFDYDILWEAEWKKRPPVDPVLLRRIGKSRAWVVVAAWDLTPVERAAMAARI